jgi:tetratricopeptide (TPR) repeat protein
MAERYAAFLSYSHRDGKVAAWLQRTLEGYRVPPYIIGRPGAFGAVPTRIGAVFRDREDLPASSDLATSVKAALMASDALIVVCSPDAAQSRWVNAEIALFKARGNAERVFALIVGGEPFASEIPGREAHECLPLALRRYVGPDGIVSDQPAEPMAADLRHECDGRRLARSKIVAGLLGISLDMLIRREHARRQRSWAALAAALMLGMLGMGALAWEANSARDTARARRDDAEQLVGFMLGDLRKRLDAVGRLDVLDAVGAQTMRYYARQDLKALDPDELAQRARALRMIGELRSMRGDFNSSGAAFEQAAATTGELLARDPQNGQRVFDHAQSVFWVGDVALQRGDRATAARAFTSYAALADRLVAIDPRRDEWQAEVASSRTNLGTMEMDDRRMDAAVADFSKAVSAGAALTARHRENTEWRSNYADSVAWLADAERFRGHLLAATDARERELALFRVLVQADPRDYPSQEYLAWTHHALGDLAMDRGDLKGAITAYGEADQIMERLLRTEAG